MNAKLKKFKELNDVIKNRNSEYINITENLQTVRRPIIGGPVYYTKGIPEMLHILLEPSLPFIPHIQKTRLIFFRTIRYNMN